MIPDARAFAVLATFARAALIVLIVLPSAPGLMAAGPPPLDQEVTSLAAASDLEVLARVVGLRTKKQGGAGR
jgi:hypothetical protein